MFYRQFYEIHIIFFVEVAIRAAALFSPVLLGSNNALDCCNVAIKYIQDKNIATITITVAMVFYGILLWAFEKMALLT